MHIFISRKNRLPVLIQKDLENGDNFQIHITPLNIDMAGRDGEMFSTGALTPIFEQYLNH
jgi:hypothetical protein